MKLQFEENEYYLMKDGEELAIATTDESFIKELGAERLSVKNCEDVVNGYDLDELAEDWCMKPENNWSNNNNEVGDNYGSYKKGFQKAMEILGDKKFSEEDMKKAIHFGASWREQLFNGTTKTSELFESLQKTEWDVSFNPEEKDADGCLILKRK